MYANQFPSTVRIQLENQEYFVSISSLSMFEMSLEKTSQDGGGAVNDS